MASVAEIKAGLRERLDAHKAPFHVTDVAAARAAIDRLSSVDGEHWGTVWSEAAHPFEERARALEAAGDRGRRGRRVPGGIRSAARRPLPDAERAGEAGGISPVGARCTAPPAGSSRRRSRS